MKKRVANARAPPAPKPAQKQAKARELTLLEKLFGRDTKRDEDDWIPLLESDLEVLWRLTPCAESVFNWLRDLFFERRSKGSTVSGASTTLLMVLHYIFPTSVWFKFGDLEDGFKRIFLKTAKTKDCNLSHIPIQDTMTQYALRDLQTRARRTVFKAACPLWHQPKERDVDTVEVSSQPTNGDVDREFFSPSQAIDVFLAWIVENFELKSKDEKKVSKIG